MLELNITHFSVYLHLFDLLGTFAFAVTGALKGIEHKFDIVGVIFLSSITGLAGGIFRDIVLGKDIPIGITDPVYLIVTTSTGFIVFFLYRIIKNYLSIFLIFDAIGLGVFSIIGSTLAYFIFGENYLIMLFSGIITAVGGGILRDITVREKPVVFVKELYITSSFLGISIFFIMIYLEINLELASIISILVITLTRIITMKLDLNLPKAKI